MGNVLTANSQPQMNFTSATTLNTSTQNQNQNQNQNQFSFIKSNNLGNFHFINNFPSTLSNFSNNVTSTQVPRGEAIKQSYPQGWF